MAIKSKMHVKYFYCKCVLMKPYYFNFHLQKVKDDKEFIKYLFDNKMYKELDFMEEFYKSLMKDSQAQKDIMNRTWFQKLEET